MRFLILVLPFQPFSCLSVHCASSLQWFSFSHNKEFSGVTRIIFTHKTFLLTLSSALPKQGSEVKNSVKQCYETVTLNLKKHRTSWFYGRFYYWVEKVLRIFLWVTGLVVRHFPKEVIQNNGKSHFCEDVHYIVLIKLKKIWFKCDIYTPIYMYLHSVECYAVIKIIENDSL